MADTLDILVPDLGESVVEATVTNWLKHEGDRVAVGEALVELETDKVNLEVSAEKAGVLAKIIRQAGEDDELAVCEDISPIGMCFRSKRRYQGQAAVEVAVPYSPEAANIFLPARIIYSEEIPKAGSFRHGTEYRR